MQKTLHIQVKKGSPHSYIKTLSWIDSYFFIFFIEHSFSAFTVKNLMNLWTGWLSFGSNDLHWMFPIIVDQNCTTILHPS